MSEEEARRVSFLLSYLEVLQQGEQYSNDGSIMRTKRTIEETLGIHKLQEEML